MLVYGAVNQKHTTLFTLGAVERLFTSHELISKKSYCFKGTLRLLSLSNAVYLVFRSVLLLYFYAIFKVKMAKRRNVSKIVVTCEWASCTFKSQSMEELSDHMSLHLKEHLGEGDAMEELGRTLLWMHKQTIKQIYNETTFELYINCN